MSKQRTLSNGLYAITHHDDLSDDKLFQDVKAVLDGGLRTLQFRDKKSSESKKFKRASELKKLCENYSCQFIINDDIELCRSIDADGVHLGLTDSSISAARDLLGDQKIIGATCHGSLQLALQAQKEGADYIALRRFFPSQTKNDAPLAEISCIKEIKQQCTLPIVAIGGITLDNAPSLIEQGIHSIALVNDLFSHKQIKERALLFSALFQK